jgi:hypothetical protein
MVKTVILTGIFFISVSKNTENDYSGRSAHALKRVQRTGIAV